MRILQTSTEFLFSSICGYSVCVGQHTLYKYGIHLYVQYDEYHILRLYIRRRRQIAHNL